MYQNLFSLTGKTVVITGGSGHLGTEMTKGLIAFGANVHVIGRDPEKFSELLKHGESLQCGGTVECHVCDVLDAARVHTVFQGIHGRSGRIDVLINNAAGSSRTPLDRIDHRSWTVGLGSALDPYFVCSSEAARYMIPAGQGVIINNASIWSVVAPNKGMYLDLNNEPSLFVSAAKGAVVQMTKHMAAFWAQYNIRVNAFSPGWFPKRRGADRPDYMNEITSRVPLKRIGLPPELVGIVVYLASDASSYVTGQNIIVDGGYTIW